MRVERICSLSAAEFYRHLPLALARWQWHETGDHIHITLDGGRATVTFEPLAPLRLSASLSLPRLRVVLAIEGAQPVRDAFIAAWDRAFQRGGG
ncbi:MAG: hypothetical protein ACM31L_12280 [Actinomycetota bacterium]